MFKTLQFVAGCAAALLTLMQPAVAADWFGLALPPGLSDPHAPTIVIGNDTSVQDNKQRLERRNPDLRGDLIRDDLGRIVKFSRLSQLTGELLWGRMAGRPGLANTVEWVAQQFRGAGLQSAAVEPFTISAPLWVPLSSTVQVIGPGPNIVLQSAFPQTGTPSANLMAPLVFVGGGSAAEIAGRDIAGKAVVVHKTPNPSLYHSRTSYAEVLAQRPAALLIVVELPGNMYSIDSSLSSTIPVFNLGGQDGQFLEGAISAAAKAGTGPLTLSVNVQTTLLANQTSANAVGIVPGKRSSEVLIINAHADGYFEGASDNGDGLAVLLALARHFAQERPDRTLVFVASSGHHTSGANGATAFIARHPEIVAKTVFVLNIEHVAQMNMETATYTPASVGKTGYRDLVADRVEFPDAVGITNRDKAPFLVDVFGRAAEVTGKNIFRQFDLSVPGDLGGYAPVPAGRAQLIYASHMYHTSGDVLATITEEGLERAAHYFEYVIRRIDGAPTSQINPQ